MEYRIVQRLSGGGEGREGGGGCVLHTIYLSQFHEIYNIICYDFLKDLHVFSLNKPLEYIGIVNGTKILLEI